MAETPPAGARTRLGDEVPVTTRFGSMQGTVIGPAISPEGRGFLVELPTGRTTIVAQTAVAGEGPPRH
jgi:hypothetical protein